MCVCVWERDCVLCVSGGLAGVEFVCLCDGSRVSSFFGLSGLTPRLRFFVCFRPSPSLLFFFLNERALSLFYFSSASVSLSLSGASG